MASWFDDNADALEAAGISQEHAREWESRNPGDTGRLIAANTNDTSDRQYDSQGPEINNGNGGTLAPAQWTQPRAAAQWTQPPPAGVGSSYGSMMSAGDYGAAPAPFGETYTPSTWGDTYTPLARPSYLQGEYTPLPRPSYLQNEYVPGAWDETFRAPEKSAGLQKEYALPTQAELEASSGYTAGADLMQRGMERSAASRGSVLSGGFVGRTLPRAMGEYANTAYNSLAGNTLGARQQNYGEYTGDVSNAFQQYQQRYGQFADAEGLRMGARGVNENAFANDEALRAGARNVNENAFATDQGSDLAGYNTRFSTHQANEAGNLAGYSTRYGKYLDQNAAKRQSEVDLWGRERDVSDLSLRAAALARPY